MTVEPENVEASFRSHGWWALAGRLLNVAVVAASAFVFVRVMPSKADFGTFIYLQSVTTLLGIVAGLGSGTVAIRWTTEARHKGRSTARRLKRIALPLVIVASSVGSIAGLTLLLIQREIEPESRDTVWAFVALGIAVAMRGTHQFLAGAARAHSRLRTANLLDGANGGPISNGLLFCGILLIACFARVTWQDAIFSLAFANFAATIIGIWLIGDLFRTAASETQVTSQGDSADERLSMLTVGVPIATASLLVFMVEQLDLLFAGWALSENSLADYSAAKRVSLLLRMPFAMVNMAVSGIITKQFISGNHVRLQSLLSGTACASVGLSLLVAIPLLIAPQTMLAFLFGDGYREAAWTMCILLAGQLVIVMGGSCQQLLILTAFERVAVKINCLSVCLFSVMLAILWFNPVYRSPEAVAVSYTATSVFRTVAMWWYARRLTGIHTAPGTLGAGWVLDQVSRVPVIEKIARRYRKVSSE